jgi:hypothetical protein
MLEASISGFAVGSVDLLLQAYNPQQTRASAMIGFIKVNFSNKCIE